VSCSQVSAAKLRREIAVRGLELHQNRSSRATRCCGPTRIGSQTSVYTWLSANMQRARIGRRLHAHSRSLG